MNHLPRLVADYLSLWRDLVQWPRLVLLNRAHSFASFATIGGFYAVNLLVGHPATVALLYGALVVCGPSALVSFAGSVAHELWERALIWPDLDCQVCGDDPDDGHDDQPDPDEPDDPHGLIREITEYLRTQPLSVR